MAHPPPYSCGLRHPLSPKGNGRRARRRKHAPRTWSLNETPSAGGGPLSGASFAVAGTCGSAAAAAASTPGTPAAAAAGPVVAPAGAIGGAPALPVAAAAEASGAAGGARPGCASLGGAGAPGARPAVVGAVDAISLSCFLLTRGERWVGGGMEREREMAHTCAQAGRGRAAAVRREGSSRRESATPDDVMRVGASQTPLELAASRFHVPPLRLSDACFCSPFRSCNQSRAQPDSALAAFVRAASRASKDNLSAPSRRLARCTCRSKLLPSPQGAHQKLTARALHAWQQAPASVRQVGPLRTQDHVKRVIVRRGERASVDVCKKMKEESAVGTAVCV
jgi:hypothetical protein